MKTAFQTIIGFFSKRSHRSVFFSFLVMFFVMSFGLGVPSVYAEEPSLVDSFLNLTWGDVGGYWLGVAKDTVSAVSDSILKPFALGIIKLEAILVNAAAVLFALVLDVEFFQAFMNNPIFYELWKMVRDTTNMIFILVLLFSAFATIFQINKYKWNNILWMVIIMALLTNFSWPISRMIIDFFNSMLYFFVTSVFHTTGVQAAKDLLSTTQMEEIFLPKQNADDWAYILLAIITLGVFMYALLKLSLLMLIRLVALPVLMFLSPIGFAGLAAPITQSYANKWWRALFQYASYGPISTFLLLASIMVLENVR